MTDIDIKQLEEEVIALRKEKEQKSLELAKAEVTAQNIENSKKDVEEQLKELGITDFDNIDAEIENISSELTGKLDAWKKIREEAENKGDL